MVVLFEHCPFSLLSLSPSQLLKKAMLCTEALATDPWASYQIRKIACCACTGNAGNVSSHSRLQRKPLVSDTGMHHGTCRDACRDRLPAGEKNVPVIPGACAPTILRIWQEAHSHQHSLAAYFDFSIDLEESRTRRSSCIACGTCTLSVQHVAWGMFSPSRFEKCIWILSHVCQ